MAHDYLYVGVPGEPLPVTAEQDVFDYIGMNYKQPHERNMWQMMTVFHFRLHLLLHFTHNHTWQWIIKLVSMLLLSVHVFCFVFIDVLCLLVFAIADFITFVSNDQTAAIILCVVSTDVETAH